MKNRLLLIEGWLAIGVNIVLFALKYWAGIVSGSTALIADAWHTLTDSFSSVIVIIGAKISAKPADSEHPFGHGRAETIAAIIIGVMLFVIAINFFNEAIVRLQNHESTTYGLVALVVTIVSILGKEALAQYAFWAGRKTNSPILKADGWHHRSDAISSVIILVGIFIGKYFWWIDAVLTMLVAGMIAYAAFEIFKETVNSLLGEKPDDDLLTKLQLVCNGVTKSDLEMHHVHIHRYGNHTELTFHIKMANDTTLEEAHDIATRIENEIDKKLNICATIHMEPNSINDDKHP